MFESELFVILLVCSSSFTFTSSVWECCCNCNVQRSFLFSDVSYLYCLFFFKNMHRRPNLTRCQSSGRILMRRMHDFGDRGGTWLLRIASYGFALGFASPLLKGMGVYFIFTLADFVEVD